MTQIYTLVGDLQKRVQETQENLLEVFNIMSAISKQPLYERKDGKKDAVLGIEEKTEKTSKKYTEVAKAAEMVKELLDKNLDLFEMREKQESQDWINYIDFVDCLIADYLYKAVGCRYMH